jgi:tetratricopeptide (TPR) repeat protein
MMHILLRVLVGTVALLAVTAPALAAGQVDWDACKGNDPDQSIAACTRIIQGRGETAKDSAIARVYRGHAYRHKGDLVRAIADLSEAIRLDPKYAEAYYNRGLTYRNKGDLDRAIADFGEAIRLAPQASAKIDMSLWPAPIVRSFLGRMPPEAVLAAADDPDPKKKKKQVCEANFYGDELALRQGAKDEALRLFRLAASGCPRDSNEWFAANAELKALGVAP